MGMLAGTHPVREYLGSLVFFKVVGLWKITDLRTLRSFFRAPFLTALRAALALAELSFPACQVTSSCCPHHLTTY